MVKNWEPARVYIMMDSLVEVVFPYITDIIMNIDFGVWTMDFVFHHFLKCRKKRSWHTDFGFDHQQVSKAFNILLVLF